MFKAIKDRVEELQDRMNEIERRRQEINDNRPDFDSYEEWEAAHENEEAALSSEFEELRVRLRELTEFAAPQSDDKDAILKHFALRLGPTFGMLKGGLMTNPEKFAINIDEINRTIAALNAQETPEMAVLYEDEDIIVKKANDGVYAGYKGRPMYKVTGVDENEFIDGDRWVLTYKKNANVITNFRDQYGTSSGLWINEIWYKEGDGTYVSDDGRERTLYEALLELVDEDGPVHGHLIGFTDEPDWKVNE